MISLNLKVHSVLIASCVDQGIHYLILKLRDGEREKERKHTRTHIHSPRTDVISLSENGIIHICGTSEEASDSQHADKPNKTLLCLTTRAPKCFNPLPTSLQPLFMQCSGVRISSEGRIETLQPLSVTDLF